MTTTPTSNTLLREFDAMVESADDLFKKYSDLLQIAQLGDAMSDWFEGGMAWRAYKKAKFEASK